MSNATLPAVRNGHIDAEIEIHEPTPAPKPQGYSLADVQIMADTVAKSGIFPSVRTPQAAFALMLLCQSEGIHPMKAMQRYHIIEGKPSKQANAMLGDFLKAGGRVEWGERTAESVTATFSHPQGGTLTVTWDIAQAKAAGLAGKDNWRKYPRQMLTARVVSEGVRAVFPDAVSGLYTPEEVMDFGPAAEVQAHPQNHSGFGRGQYASPDQVESYNLALRSYVDRQNAEWADSWTNKTTGEVADGVPELINPWQANGHLLKWAQETGLLETGSVPEDVKAGQIPKYVAIVYHRSTADRKALTNELKRYVVEQAERKTAKFYRDHPELDPDREGCSDDAGDFPVDEDPGDPVDQVVESVVRSKPPKPTREPGE